MPRVSNRTHVSIIQHPRERSHPLGTARLAALALERSELMVWGTAEMAAEERMQAFRDRLPANTALLYPSPGARSLHELSAEDMPESLVVLDGTWHHARTLFRDNAWLHDLPHVLVTPSRPSGFGTLRREPLPGCTSTLEAIVEALRAIEPETAKLDALLGTFDAMIARQAHFTERRPNPRRKVRRTQSDS